jgi:hypothetical protein
VNYLFERFLMFSQGRQTRQTNLWVGGWPYQRASGTIFDGWTGKQQIAVATIKSPVCQSFAPTVEFPAPGIRSANQSHAKAKYGILEGSRTTPIHSFYNSKTASNTLESPGPIVVHGGFTSALIISIAC